MTDKTRDELFAEHFEDLDGSVKVAEHAYRQGWKDRATYTVVPDGTPSVPPIALAGEPVASVSARYRVEPTHAGFWPYKVVCGDGTRELFKGHRTSCERVAAELQTAFLDGVFTVTNGDEQ